MAFALSRSIKFIDVPQVDQRVIDILVRYLPRVHDMRRAGSQICPYQPAAGMRHICVVNVDPSSESFGVLFELVLSFAQFNDSSSWLMTSNMISVLALTHTRGAAQ